MNTEAEDPKAFHQRMWREYGPKQAPSLGGADQAIIEQARNDIRDAALEDAATVDLTGMTEWARGVVRERIRALKSKPAPRGHTKDCGMDTNHKGPCVASPPSDTKPEPAEPVHDFGWALQKMQQGQRVVDPTNRNAVFLDGDRFVRMVGDRMRYVDFSSSALLATNWEVVE